MNSHLSMGSRLEAGRLQHLHKVNVLCGISGVDTPSEFYTTVFLHSGILAKGANRNCNGLSRRMRLRTCRMVMRQLLKPRSSRLTGIFTARSQESASWGEGEGE